MPEGKTFWDVETWTIGEITLTYYYNWIGSPAYFFNRLKSNRPRNGGGRKVLVEILRFIDDVGVPLVNTPNAYGEMSEKDLIAFYKRYGFVDDKDGLLVYYPRKEGKHDLGNDIAVGSEQ